MKKQLIWVLLIVFIASSFLTYYFGVEAMRILNGESLPLLKLASFTGYSLLTFASGWFMVFCLKKMEQLARELKHQRDQFQKH